MSYASVMPREGAAMDLGGAILYRLAFGLASELAEADQHRFPGRYGSNRAAGGTIEAIAAEVLPGSGQMSRDRGSYARPSRMRWRGGGPGGKSPPAPIGLILARQTRPVHAVNDAAIARARPV